MLRAAVPGTGLQRQPLNTLEVTGHDFQVPEQGEVMTVSG
jgi:hypothetical protein